uniref:Band 3 cytoplasmic domain-containing protein n=1 Tax=Musca domestica TaxID=7370 RepID=A0A1I8M6T2_MUSDO
MNPDKRNTSDPNRNEEEIELPWTMHTSSGDDEASKDPRIIGDQDFSQQYTENDFEGHRAHSVYVGVHVPGGRRHSQRRRKHHHGKSDSSGDERQPEVERPVTPPAQRVQFILGEDADDGTHVSHPLFSEYLTLVKEGDEIEWKETARWIKFEEDVEEGGNRWSKPHVATLSLHSLFELRTLLLNGSVILDMEANSLELIADLVCENMVNARTLPADSRDKVKDALLRRHRHQHEYNKKTKLPIIRSLADIGRNHSSSKKDMIKSPSSQSMQRNSSGNDLSDHRANMNFMRKIPPGAEASNILVGEVDFLEKPLAGFIRLKDAAIMGDLTEVPVPT